MLDDGSRPKRVVVEDLMQHGYEYALVAPAGSDFAPAPTTVRLPNSSRRCCRDGRAPT